MNVIRLPASREPSRSYCKERSDVRDNATDLLLILRNFLRQNYNYLRSREAVVRNPYNKEMSFLRVERTRDRVQVFSPLTIDPRLMITAALCEENVSVNVTRN